MSAMTPPSPPWKDPSRLLLVAGVVALSLYVVLRAMFVAITHDEAYTFFHYVLKPIDETLNVTYTNNHLLNSLLVRFCTFLFGESEFSLRLPNVICAILFFVFSARLLLKMRGGKWFAVIGLLVLSFNTFMFDFFALSRGYGISLGLLMVAMYYQYRSFEEKNKTRYEWAAVLLTAIACTANYTLLNLLLVVVGINISRVIWKVWRSRGERSEFRRNMGSLVGLLLLSFITLKFMVDLMFSLNELGNFNFGGDNSLWIDCVEWMAMFSCITIDPFWDSAEKVYAYAGAAILILGVVYCGIALVRREWKAQQLFTLFLVLVITGCGMAIYLQHTMMNVPYPKDRTVLYIVPLISLLALAITCTEWKIKWINSIAAALFFIPAVGAQCCNFNLSKSIYWHTSRDIDVVAQKVIAEAKSFGDLRRPVLVVVPFDDFPSMDYYLYRTGTGSVQTMTYMESSWISIADIAIDYSDPVAEKTEAPYTRVAEISDKYVFIRTPKPTYSPPVLMQQLDFEDNASLGRAGDAGFRSYTADHVDSVIIASRAVVVTLDSAYRHGTTWLATFQMRCDREKFHAEAIMSAVRDGQTIVWKTVDLSAYMRSADTWTQISVLLYSSEVLKSGDILRFHVFNRWGVPVSVDDFKVEMIPAK